MSARAKQIVQAWARSMRPTLNEQQTARVRLTVCNGCEHKTKKLTVEVCGLCGCVVSKKVFVEDRSGCPDGRWPV